MAETRLGSKRRGSRLSGAGYAHEGSEKNRKRTGDRLIFLPPSSTSRGAYCPDLPGCVATGDTYEEAEAAMHEALRMHLEGLEEDGLPLTQSTSTRAASIGP